MKNGFAHSQSEWFWLLDLEIEGLDTRSCADLPSFKWSEFQATLMHTSVLDVRWTVVSGLVGELISMDSIYQV